MQTTELVNHRSNGLPSVMLGDAPGNVETEFPESRTKPVEYAVTPLPPELVNDYRLRFPLDLTAPEFLSWLAGEKGESEQEVIEARRLVARCQEDLPDHELLFSLLVS